MTKHTCDDLQFAPKLGRGFAELAADAKKLKRKQEAARRGAERQVAELWQKLVRTFGKKEAATIVSSATGIRITPAGRKPVHDVLDDLIDDGIEYLRSKGVQKINQKRFAQMIQNAIKKQPLTDHVLVADDEDWDYEEVVVYRHVEDETLRVRIRNGLKRFDELHGG